MMVGAPHVSFRYPPVVEVVCGIQFKASVPMSSANFAEFWREVKSEFPRTEDKPPLPTMQENERAPQLDPFIVQADDPTPRVWFIDTADTHLLQIQRDRFLLNWKKVDEEYPRFKTVYQKFRDYISIFEAFCSRNLDCGLTPTQYELTYVNMIDTDTGVAAENLHDVLVDHKRDATRERYLPLPEAVNWRTAYSLPDAFGRLYVNARTVYKQSSPSDKAMRLELSARGMGSDDNSMDRWFAVAHEAITRGFADITDTDVQRASWERQQ